MLRMAMLGAGFVANFYMQGLWEVPDQQVVMIFSCRSNYLGLFSVSLCLSTAFRNYGGILNTNSLVSDKTALVAPPFRAAPPRGAESLRLSLAGRQA